ncbi:hypothetical protein KGM_212959 [Danaus plexippus plexippus]|uniref:Uncharacterized protein n=1 Tax=Danaus plexippus plexippus TaxID=278856 RepID=A0A212F5N7_DANPL|nr:hypothetical protein KGM_212959 [Danaus plexippus plexippus]
MTQPWKFSESSQDLLERFVKSSEKIGRSKWVKEFGHKTTDLLETYNLTGVDRDDTFVISSDESSSDTIILGDKNDEGDEMQSIPTQFSQDVAVREPVTHIDYIMKKCRKDPRSYNLLASNLTEGDMEKLLEHILNSTLDHNFTDKILMELLPTYLKKYPSRNSIDLLIKTREKNIFNNLFEVIMKDTDIQSVVLQEYTSVLKSNADKSDLLNNIISYNISDEVFTYHLETILIMYKDCNKTKDINCFILTKLTQTSQNGATDKNYGRLLHLYLQNLRCNPAEAASCLENLEKLIDTHHSPFRRPCINIFNEIKKYIEV